MKNLVLGMVVAAGASTLWAQNNPAINQTGATQQRQETEKVLRGLSPGDALPALYADEEEDVGPQSVLLRKRQTWFRVAADSEIYYTDNMQFQDKNPIAAGVSVTTLDAALTPPAWITRRAAFRSEFGYREQFFNYLGGDGREDFDFNAGTAYARVLAQTKHYQFGVGVDYTRLLGFEPLRSENREEFYNEWVPRWSVQRNFRVCDQSMVSLSYLGSYHFADEAQPVIVAPPFVPVPHFASDRSSRWEQTFLAVYSVALPHRFALQPYYRFQLTDYANVNETTYLNTVGLMLGWFPREYVSVRAFVGYNWQTSAHSQELEYQQLNTGGGLNLTFRF